MAFLDDVFTPVDLVPTSFAPRLVDEAGKERDIPPIDAIFVSHAHSDHFGDPTAFPGDVPIIYGPGTAAWVQSGAPNVQLPREYLQQHPILEVGTGALGNGKRWQRIGPFDKGWDFFGDGSLWLIQAPGVSCHAPSGSFEDQRCYEDSLTSNKALLGLSGRPVSRHCIPRHLCLACRGRSS